MDEASPRFRTDLEAAATESDGVACVDVADPQTGTKFRFYDFEYQLALQLNGQPLAAVVAWAAAAYDVELTPAGVGEFAGRLAELGFLEGKPPTAPEITDMGARGPTAITTAPEITDMGAGGPTAVSAPSEISNMGEGQTAVTAVAAVPAAPESTDMGAGPTAVTAPEITDMGANGPTAVTASAAVSEVKGAGAPDAIDSPEADWTAPQQIQTATFVPDSAMLVPTLDRTPVASSFPFLKEAERTPPPRPVTPPSAKPPSPPSSPAAAAPAPSKAAEPEPSIPVARLSEAPTVRIPPAEVSVAVTRPAEAPTMPSIPSKVAATPPPVRAEDVPTPPPRLPGITSAVGTSGPGAAKAPPAAWAMELDGAFGTPSSKMGPAEPALPSPAAPAAPPPVGGAADRVAPPPAGLPERRQPPKPEAVVMSDFSGEEAAGASAKKGTGRIVVAVVLVAVAAAVSYFAWSRSRAQEPHAVRVRAMTPRPTAVYRWFSGHGVVVEDESRTIAFEGPGRLIELLPAGAEFGAGEILGRLQGSAAIETLLAHHRSRLAFHEQMRESMRAAGNQAETRQAELKLAEKQRLIADTTAALARVTLRSNEPGEVVETLATVGSAIKPGTPVIRVKGRLLHGEFRLEADELQAAGKLGLCRLEVVGLGPHASNAEPRRPSDPVADSGPAGPGVPRFIDCTAPARAGDKLTVALPSEIGLVPGQPLRLARERLDAVFPIPAAALESDGAQRAVWIAGRDGLAERRPVTIAGLDDREAYVGAGLRVGDEVIVEAPAGLAPGALIVTEH